MIFSNVDWDCAINMSHRRRRAGICSAVVGTCPSRLSRDASPDQQPSCHNYPRPHEALNNLTPDEWKRNLEITEIHKSNTVC
jgi:hypothetical protein